MTTPGPLVLTKLTPGGDLVEGLRQLRTELSQQLLGGATDRPFGFAIVASVGEIGGLAGTDITTGEVQASARWTHLLEFGAPLEGVKVLVHQVVHSIGEGPAFVRLEEQLLEEAITETITQSYLGEFMQAFGGMLLKDDGPLFRMVAGGEDLEITRPTPTSVSVERFGRLAAWLEQLDVDEDATGDELDAAALAWACKLKATPGDKRFELLAEAGAALGQGEHGDDVGAVDWLEEYFRGYMKQLDRSEVGFAGLTYAAGRAWGDPDPAPAPLELERPPWAAELAACEKVTLNPLPPAGQLGAALRRAQQSPEVADQIIRSLDARALLWAARTIASAQK